MWSGTDGNSFTLLASDFRRFGQSLLSARKTMSVYHLERGAVLRPRAAVIVNARGADVRMAKPFLHLGDVGLVIERVGGGRRAERMRADLKAERRRIAAHQLIYAVRRDRAFGLAGAIVAD